MCFTAARTLALLYLCHIAKQQFIKSITIKFQNFEYKNENMQVVEAYNLDHADTKDGHYQERNHQYVGSTRDIGLVEVNFKLK